MRVLVDQAVEDRFSADLLCVDVGHGGAESVAFVVRDVLRDALVRPDGVVVRLVFGGLDSRFTRPSSGAGIRASDARPRDDASMALLAGLSGEIEV